MYKIGLVEILHHLFLECERLFILNEAHVGVLGDHYTVKDTVPNILQVRLWCPTMHVDPQDYCHSYDICQRMGKMS